MKEKVTGIGSKVAGKCETMSGTVRARLLPVPVLDAGNLSPKLLERENYRSLWIERSSRNTGGDSL